MARSVRVTIGEIFSHRIFFAAQQHAHNGVVSCLSTEIGGSPPQVYSGGDDSQVKIYSLMANPQTLPGSASLEPMSNTNMNDQVKSMTMIEGCLFCGLNAGRIVAFRKADAATFQLGAAGQDGHTGAVLSILQWGTHVISGSWDATVRFWTYNQGNFTCELALPVNHPVTALCIIQDTILVCACNGAIVYVSLPNLQAPQGPPTVVNRIQLPNETATGAVAYHDHAIVSFLSGRICVYDANGVEKFNSGNSPQGPMNGITCIEGIVDSNGQEFLVAGENNGSISLYKLPSFEKAISFEAHASRKEVRALKFLQSGFFLSCDAAGEIRVIRACQTHEDSQAAGGMMDGGGLM
uniref:Anaphase-promoting complex subunit 4 WD40 domain-containing protein n=1 Tax=Chromera velia CCMP2878 TaxID=1169474 RepID=A0A0G4GCN4_9ALVE|eukprot:Cvel_21328.t1-p1 / transcript=Cvel_21328.t1 / gene=Cvel_21328 / organism=Chromera_velia_CCMP2878 / gene_product=hypothetical protein / transcript_product=hypothetical protein / location=Cvel_scaffold1989:5048-10193(+) / protein_length=350 / sequence_SO=supercontig / SO=protein_coding / is_pseudo=false